MCQNRDRLNKLSGRITSQQNTPLQYATVAIYRNSDSSLVTGVITDSTGRYEFSQLPVGRYYIKATLIGYKKGFYGPFQITSSTSMVQIPTFSLPRNEALLKEVQVVGKKPLIEYQFDKIIVNVDDRITAAGNSAFDVLRFSPLVGISANDLLTLKGKTGVSITIDGKPTHLSKDQLNTLLKSIRAEDISKIEIIPNPSAKYDASGSAGIINIILKKKQDEGLNGSLNLTYSQALYSNLNVGLGLNYRKRKINLFGNLNATDGKYWNRVSSIRNFYNNSSTKLTTQLRGSGRGITHSKNEGIRAGIEYDINDNNSIGLMTNIVLNNYNLLNFKNPTFFENPKGDIDSISDFTNTGTSSFHSYTYDLNYVLKLDTSGSILSASFDYSKSSIPKRRIYITNYYDGDWNAKRAPDFKKGTFPINITIKSGKIDYTHPIKNSAKLEIGVKSSWVLTDNNVIYNDSIGSEWRVDSNSSNHFKYKENINAAYINFNKTLKRGWKFQIGVRGEQTISTANQITIDSIVKRNYFELFPSFVVQKKINKKNTLSLSYSRRINRPDYQSLNPFQYYVDQYDYQVGNSYLNPEFTNSLDLSYLFNNTLSVSIDYSHKSGAITTVIYQIDSIHTTYETSENINSLDNYGLNMSFPVRITKWWMTNNSGGVYYNHYKGILNNASLNKGTSTFYFNTFNSFNLPGKINGEISGFYQSKERQGAFVLFPVYSLSAGMQKSLLNKALTVRLNINDIFNTIRSKSYENFNNIDTRYLNTQQSRKINISISYNFGNRKVKINKPKNAIDVEQSRIKHD